MLRGRTDSMIFVNKCCSALPPSSATFTNFPWNSTLELRLPDSTLISSAMPLGPILLNLTSHRRNQRSSAASGATRQARG